MILNYYALFTTGTHILIVLLVAIVESRESKLQLGTAYIHHLPCVTEWFKK